MTERHVWMLPWIPAGASGTRARAAMAYAAAMLVTAATCVLQPREVLPLAVGVAVPSVLAAAALGYALGDWYRPIDGERPTFELVAVPALVALGAPILGAGMFLLVGLALFPSGANDSPLHAFPGAIAMTLGYLSATWPVVLCAFGLAGVVLARGQRRH